MSLLQPHRNYVLHTLLYWDISHVEDTYERIMEKEILAEDTSNVDTAADDEPLLNKTKKCIIRLY